MTQSLLYQRTPCTLKQVAHSTCPNGYSEEVYEQFLLERNPTISRSEANLSPNKPILLQTPGKADTVANIASLNACTREQHNMLADLSSYAGGAAVMGVASFLWDNKIPDQVGQLLTFGGSGMGASTASSNAILSAINNYDRALNNYETLKNHRAAPRSIRAAKAQAKRAFEIMNQELAQRSFHYLNSAEFKMQQTTNAAGRKVWQSIPIRDNIDVQKLAKFAKFGKALGPGVIVLDGGLRANKVNSMRVAGDPSWKRERFIQTGSFIIAVGTGLAIAAALTPLGLIIAFAAGGVAGLVADNAASTLLATIHDSFFND